MGVLSRAAIGVLCLLGIVSPAAAQAPSLAGWWIGIDDGYLRFVKDGLIIPVEELLIVDRDGKAESRLMLFSTPTAFGCDESRRADCHDAPMTFRARIEAGDREIVFSDRVRAEEDEAKQADREGGGLTLIAMAPRWSMETEANGERLILQAGGVKRVFARIDPDRLRRLRAAYLLTDRSAAIGWRCFLSNATAGDPVFDPVGGPRRKAGDWVDGLLRAASRLTTLIELSATPTPDSPDKETAQLAGIKVAQTMLEAVDGMARPAAFASVTKLVANRVFYLARLGGDSREEAEKLAKRVDPAWADPRLLSDDEIKLLARYRSLEERGKDPEFDALFCNVERRGDPALDIPGPRPDFDAFRGIRPPGLRQ